MTESALLYGLVLWTFIAAPRMTSRLFLGASRAYDGAHALALLVLLGAAALDLPRAAAVWPVFCAFGFFLHLRNEGRRVFSIGGAARCIPFVFSLVSATWFVAGRNDLHMLGYDTAWSYYATLHGSVLGWLVVGCVAYLATRKGARTLYLWACYLSLPLFLAVAFGIDGVPYVKRLGVVGLSIGVPLVIGRYALDLRLRKAPASFGLALASFVVVVATMALALLNELWPVFPPALLGMPTMVVLHGSANALLVAPGFFLAIACDPETAPAAAG